MIYGLKNVLKGLKEGKIKKVVYAENTPEEFIKKVKEFGVKLEKFNGSNIELGAKIGRSHRITIVGLENEDKI